MSTKSHEGLEIRWWVRIEDKQTTFRKDSRRLEKKVYIKSESYLDSETTPSNDLYI